MEIFDGYYYRTSKRFLEICGFWPYEAENKRQMKKVIFYVVNFSLAIPQLILLCQLWIKDFGVTVENSVSLMFAAAVCAKYFAGFASKNRLRLLLEQIAEDWQRLTDPAERAILAKNTSEGRFYSLWYIGYLFIAWLLYTILPLTPLVLDVIVPLNESRPLLLPFYANYIFFDQVDYHYWTCVHIGVVYLGSFFMFSGIDTIFVTSVKHTCGLFEIVCYRLKNMLPSEESRKKKELDHNKTAIANVIRAVQLHSDTIRCFELLEDSFNLSFLLVNGMCVLALALGCSYGLIIYAQVYKIIRVIAFMIGIVVHLLFLNWVGQQMINSSEKVFISAYFSPWYTISNKGRLLINVMMVRSLTPCILTAGKLAYLSMANFGILLKTTMSYFTAFLSFSE